MEKKYDTGKLKSMTPEQIAEALKERARARANGDPLPDPPEPGPTYEDVLQAATSSPPLYAALHTARARGFEGQVLCNYVILELTAMLDRIWSAYSNALDHVPMTYRLKTPIEPRS